MSNRITELESAVNRLEATVNGLQEALVDANERIRALERELDRAPADEGQSQADPSTPPGVDLDGSESTDDTVEESDPLDDIIVA